MITGFLKKGGMTNSAEKEPFTHSRSDQSHDGVPDTETGTMDDGSASPEGSRNTIRRRLGFDIGDVLQLRTFIYLFVITIIFLFQTHNTIAIKNLAMQNELLREQLQMSTSVITAQELKASELQSIHNITECTGALGLHASSVPAVELAVP